jgi:hypothetical protein
MIWRAIRNANAEIVSEGFTPQRTRDQRSIGNVQAFVAETAAILVGDSFRRVLCHTATAQRMRHAKVVSLPYQEQTGTALYR